MNQSDIAWAAGLFEGEGCFHARRIKHNWRAMLEMSISSTDRDVLARFHNIVQEGTLKDKATPKAKPHWKPQYAWRCSGAPALAIAALIEPYLGRRRRERLNEIRTIIAESQPMPRECELCRETFTPKRFARQRFCSERCRDRAKYERRHTVAGAIPGTRPEDSIR